MAEKRYPLTVSTSYYIAVGYKTDTCYRIIYVSFNTEILRFSSKPTKKKEDRLSAEQTGDPDIHIPGADLYGLNLGFLGQGMKFKVMQTHV